MTFDSLEDEFDSKAEVSGGQSDVYEMSCDQYLALRASEKQEEFSRWLKASCDSECLELNEEMIPVKQDHHFEADHLLHNVPSLL
mmetsp:Transcript_36730/g.27190  ORF Transcript_36730/g.27190 Transcript_36730/m.27190 type:complete len:85 (+) Transcript_36730:166-420(+)